MNLNLVTAAEIDKSFFWHTYCQSMRSHIQEIWGWDEEWQKADFETRWADCENRLIYQNGQAIGFIQTKDFANEHYIMMFILLPEHRSNGVGRQIITQIKNSVKLGYISLRVFRTNMRALKFYKSQGFVNVADEGDFYYLKQAAL